MKKQKHKYQLVTEPNGILVRYDILPLKVFCCGKKSAEAEWSFYHFISARRASAQRKVYLV